MCDVRPTLSSLDLDNIVIVMINIMLPRTDVVFVVVLAGEH